jgi:N-sulfoglucosamine sulfohydrolase
MDQGIGILFEHLKKSGHWDNTVIIYISDNGIAFPGAKTNIYQPGINLPCIIKYPKMNVKDAIIEAKVNWADITPTILDIAGLLPEAKRVLQEEYRIRKEKGDNTVNKTFHGRSFKSILEGKTDQSWDETYASHTFHEITMYYPMRSVISGNYKLIYNIAHQLPYPHATDLWASSTWQGIINSDSSKYALRSVEDYTYRDEFELYDLFTDPYETQNLAEDEKYADLLKLLKKKIKDFQIRTNDPWFAKWTHE